jgi:hypothetical protein
VTITVTVVYCKRKFVRALQTVSTRADQKETSVHKENFTSQTCCWLLHTCNFRQDYEVCNLYIVKVREGRQVIIKRHLFYADTFVCCLRVRLSFPIHDVGFIVSGILFNNIIAYTQ